MFDLSGSLAPPQPNAERFYMEHQTLFVSSLGIAKSCSYYKSRPGFPINTDFLLSQMPGNSIYVHVDALLEFGSHDLLRLLIVLPP